MHKKFGKGRACGATDILKDTHTDVLITILASNFKIVHQNHTLY